VRAVDLRRNWEHGIASLLDAAVPAQTRTEQKARQALSELLDAVDDEAETPAGERETEKPKLAPSARHLPR
jgi:hypothetical protein